VSALFLEDVDLLHGRLAILLQLAVSPDRVLVLGVSSPQLCEGGRGQSLAYDLKCVIGYLRTNVLCNVSTHRKRNE
jgi:hypothetical protein